MTSSPEFWSGLWQELAGQDGQATSFLCASISYDKARMTRHNSLKSDHSALLLEFGLESARSAGVSRGILYLGIGMASGGRFDFGWPWPAVP